MCRKLITTSIIIAIFVAIILAIPYLMGHIIENKYKKVLSEFSTPGKTIQLASYRRGWFSSSAILIIAIQKRFRENTTQPFHYLTYVQTIKHGPLVFDHGHIYLAEAISDGSLLLSPKQQQEFTKYNSAPPQINIRAIYTIRGDIDSYATFTPFSYHQKKHVIDFLGGSCAAHLNRDLDKLRTTLTIDGIKITSEKTTITLGKLFFNHEANRYGVKLWLGTKNLLLKSLDIIPTKGDKVHLANILLNGTSSLANNLISAKFLLLIPTFTAGSANYAPTKLNLSIDNLKPSALTAAATTLHLLGSNNNMLTRLMLTKHFATQILDGTTIHLNNLLITTPNGAIHADATINNPQLQSNTANRFFSLASAKMALTVPKTIVNNTTTGIYKMIYAKNSAKIDPAQKATQDLARLVTEGYLLPRNDSYTTTLNYQNNQLTINGKAWKPSNGGNSSIGTKSTDNSSSSQKTATLVSSS